MKQEEKTKRTREKILAAAAQEFADKGFDKASVNEICQKSGCPKGLLYHNFKNKDELYLCCMENCYQNLLASMEAVQPGTGIEALLARREAFFKANPEQAALFFSAMHQPPAHLENRIRQVRAPFEAFCRQRYEAILDRLPLREGVSRQSALEYFTIFLDLFNGFFMKQAQSEKDSETLAREHEQKLAEMLDLMLYGVVRQKTSEDC